MNPFNTTDAVSNAIDRIAIPNCIVPAQQWRRYPGDEGLRRLMRAVMDDAMRCLSRHYVPGESGGGVSNERRLRPRIQQMVAETLEWVRSRDDGPFSFDTICGELRYDADQLRAHVLAGKLLPFEKGLAAQSENEMKA